MSDKAFVRGKVVMSCPKCGTHAPNLISKGCPKCGFKPEVVSYEEHWRKWREAKEMSVVENLEEVLKNKSKLGMNVTIMPKDRRRRWVRLSDVLELVGDLEKTHVIISREELAELFDDRPSSCCDVHSAEPMEYENWICMLREKLFRGGIK